MKQISFTPNISGINHVGKELDLKMVGYYVEFRVNSKMLSDLKTNCLNNLLLLGEANVFTISDRTYEIIVDENIPYGFCKIKQRSIPLNQYIVNLNSCESTFFADDYGHAKRVAVNGEVKQIGADI